ncbi:MAG: hypothetical protein PHC75_01365 [Burkholderiales bacterium]|nr:hypothetical protein [Burkholderiales bacterium]
MKLKLVILSIVSLGAIVACSSAPTADNYSQTMNEPAVQNGAVNSKGDKKLNEKAWNNLEVANITSTHVSKDGSYAYNKTEGYLFIRANIVNEGDSPAQAKWRCKFYDSNGIAVGDDDNNKPATNETGIGWHTMLAYPVAASSHTHEENLIRCVAPSKLATEFRVEVHDTANDVTVYK